MAVTPVTSHQSPVISHADFGKIGVLMGGPSTEREISLRSGAAVFGALKALGIETSAIDITDGDLKRARAQIEKERIKTAFIALHGKFGEDGTIQKLLEEMGICYPGSGVEASKRALNKIAARKLFKEAGLFVPEAEVVRKNNVFTKKAKNFPVVVKPASSGSSIGLTIVEKEADLDNALKDAFGYDDDVLIEEYIAGRECTVGILGESPLAVIEIIPKSKFFDYQAKYTKGLTEYVVPAKLAKDIYTKTQEAALRAHRALGCFGFSRADIIISSDRRAFVLEVNTIPGLTEMSLLPKAALAEGIDFRQLCLKLLSFALEKQG